MSAPCPNQPPTPTGITGRVLRAQKFNIKNGFSSKEAGEFAAQDTARLLGEFERRASVATPAGALGQHFPQPQQPRWQNRGGPDNRHGYRYDQGASLFRQILGRWLPPRSKLASCTRYQRHHFAYHAYRTSWYATLRCHW